MYLVDGVKNLFQSTNYLLLSKRSTNILFVYVIALGCDVLPKPGIDGIGTKKFNGIVDTTEKKMIKMMLLQS